MFKKYIKPILKKERVLNFGSFLIYLYLKLVYITSNIEFICPVGYTKTDFDNDRKTIFALWHNRLLFGPCIFTNHQCITSPLISSHSDGKIINNIVKRFGYRTIEGSTNKNSFVALKNVIKTLSSGENIFINPDGPRGPVYEINSNITNIAKKYASKLVPISCFASKYFRLKSWDQLIIPKPFSRIVVLIGESVDLSGSEAESNTKLKQNLITLSETAENYIKV